MSETSLSVGLAVHVALGAPATYDAAGFADLSWTEVMDAESVPEFGGTAQIPEFIPIKTGVVDKGKGSINYGETTLPIRRRITDAGQVFLQSAFDGAERDSTISVKLSHPHHGLLYFTAVVSSFTYNFSDANSWYMGSVGFAVKTKPLPVTDAYVVTFVAGANGSIIGQTEQHILTGGDASAVYAAAASGYQFDSWTGTVETDNPLTLTNVTADDTITANFVVL